MQRAVEAQKQALESRLEQLHQTNIGVLVTLESEQRAVAESMRSTGQALQAVIEKASDAEAFDAAADAQVRLLSFVPPCVCLELHSL